MPLYIGLMSGTSVDAVDAVLVDIAACIALIATDSHPIPEPLRRKIRAVAAGTAGSERRVWHLDTQLGELYAQATLALLKKTGVSASQIHALGSHGQTIYHAPNDSLACTVQIGDPNIIAERTGITTVADFRRRDLAAGGQGAPLAPAFHHQAFADKNEHRVIINIGGIANITVLAAGGEGASVRGFDTGPGNGLLDAWIRRHHHLHYDDNGHWAATGDILLPLLERLLDDPYFDQKPPKSTGTEYFNLTWLDQQIATLDEELAAHDVQRTLCTLTTRTLSESITRYAPYPTAVFVCGGGVHNQTLMDSLRQEQPATTIATTEALGIGPDWIEATTFAWLAQRTMAGLTSNLPAVTGARSEVILGGIYQR